jgi:o-succinylbenzoate synthase
VKIERIEMREISIPLVHFFETSFGRTYVRHMVLVRLFSEGLVGFGECTAGEGPFYNYETTETSWHIIKDFLVPQMLKSAYDHPDQVDRSFKAIRGHNMAKAALETAFWDLTARACSMPLYRLIGGERTRIPCGVSIGIQDTPEDLLARIETELASGYQRIKVKIKPGWDVEVIRRIRERFPSILLMGDANSAYRLEDAEHLRQLDQYGLMMIEQPLGHNDIVDHRNLQAQLRTPICLDESILGVDDAQKALELGSCRIINVKLGRVGGFTEAKKISDLCVSRGIPIWCGGMLEAGIGRAHNIAMSTLAGFTLPGDVSASKRYYKEDIIHPPVEVDSQGFIAVPEEPGIGFEPDLERIEAVTLRKLDIRP